MYKRSKLKRITINVLMVVLLVIGLGLIFNNQIRSYMLSQRSKQYNLTNFTQEKLEENLKKSGNFDFDSVESISNELVLKAQFDNTELPVFIPVFLLHFKKKIYLCHTLSAHQRDEIGRRRFYFLME